MNKSAIRSFAVAARAKLKEQIKDKAAIYGITEKEIKKIELFGDGFRVGGKTYDKATLAQYRQLVRAIEQKGFDNVIEEVAYTWFNRFIALRFMEVNEYMPFNIHTKVLAGVDGKNEPEIISVSKDLELASSEMYYSCLDKGDIEGLYKAILINLCNKLSKIMPNMFEKISDYTELLLPDHLYTDGGIINLLVSSIDEEDFTDQVEIIGWLYQFYISEKKAQVDDAVAKGKKVSKDDLPAKTQLFTPDWIVKYLVENSLGRLWLEKGDENSPLKENWKYYLDGELIKDGSKLSPEEIKIIDPACGSGHMLVYAFDVLYDIYVSCGYPERDIPQLILEKNLYGIDIDERAAQLAYFALIMKARSKNRRLFRKEEPITVNVCSIKESNDIASIERPEQSQFRIDDRYRQVADYLIKTFYNAREYGSILKVEPMDYDGLLDYVDELSHQGQLDIFDSAFINQVIYDMPDLVRQAKILSQKYDVYITNPPYLGKGMSPLLSDYVKENYPDSKSDLFAVFMELPLLKQGGYLAMINQHSWMFLSSYERLRQKIIQTYTLISMLHLGPHTFEEISGEVVQSTAFILNKSSNLEFIGKYIRLVDFSTSYEKEIRMMEAIKNANCEYVFKSISTKFSKIPGGPFAYWVSQRMISSYLYATTLKNVSTPRAGLATGDNSIFQKLWYEVSLNSIGFNYCDISETIDGKHKWFPCNSGGDFRKWSTKNEYVVNWQYDGREIRNFRNANGKFAARPQNTQFYFKEGLTWNKLSSSKFGAKFKEKGFIYDDTSRSSFPEDNTMVMYILGFLCSNVCFEFLRALNPTMSFTNSDIERLPLIFDLREKSVVDSIVSQNIILTKADLDDFETSWDFKVHPLIRYKAANIEQAFVNWVVVTDERFRKLKANEEELNRIFIEIYGLQDELNPEVADEDVTVRRADLDRDIRSLISYAVGCMFGRYSLDREGLVYAGGTFDKGAYSTFIPVQDNIIPITSEEYFENDIVSLFIEFVEKVYGSETLEENLTFIAKALKPTSTKTARQIIREYFFNDFFKDHCKIYKKRPIYWQFETGPAGAMKALVYLHRMDEFTPARVRTDYLHPLMRAYEGEIKRIDQMLEDSLTAAEKASYRKKKEDLQKKTAEIMKYDPVIAHIASRRIKLDLDDGVVVNYQKYQNVEVIEDGKPSVTANLLTKI
ncbi:BREX-1 system adenine-specific DNA-methyltransferase PglX [Acetivibrio mesophilus]|uniref:site-specific DNA-methyltransferase (adenine-specific) n=1 Tax=Acetivibrio mesophilus TaxID=2487273 RepID=A0A4Q0I214_9FIRM|nr:BREX-1 system adenine-specific DNA-methyltransferase PglX [Acetivibrio mesophilus]RXE57715.1 BREX-1 system adenine-specific DNA-methyltransferase PglX [Acetivibrio mesophilus]